MPNNTNSSRQFNLISRELLAVLGFLVMQTFGAIWFAGQLDQRVRNIEDTLKAANPIVLKAELQAVEDLIIRCGSLHQNLDQKLDKVVEGLARFEGRHKDGE